MTAPIIKRLCLLALYTSPVISALVVTPLFIVSKYKFVEYPIGLVLILLLVLFMWGLNIWIGHALSNKTNLARYLTSYLFCVLLTVLIVQHMFGQVHGLTGHSRVFHFHLIMFFSINTSILILQDLTLVKEKNALIENENMQLRMKNMEAANQQLKHQLQPHFLFNSLSTLKALIKSSPTAAEEYLVKLADFLRYSVAAGKDNVVKVSDEIKLCVDYLEMQQIRFGDALQFTIQVPAEVAGQKYLPVFALQVLAENAIKHNMLTVYTPLVITINYADGLITVSNNLQQNEVADAGAGTGLANLQERYKILANENITIAKTGGTFSVSIKVLDYENSDNRG